MEIIQGGKMCPGENLPSSAGLLVVIYLCHILEGKIIFFFLGVINETFILHSLETCLVCGTIIHLKTYQLNTVFTLMEIYVMDTLRGFS